MKQSLQNNVYSLVAHFCGVYADLSPAWIKNIKLSLLSNNVAILNLIFSWLIVTYINFYYGEN